MNIMKRTEARWEIVLLYIERYIEYYNYYCILHILYNTLFYVQSAIE